jgi:hypothetical protein
MQDDQDDDNYLKHYKKGYTVTNAASALSYKPEKIKSKKAKGVSEEKYFEAITRHKPEPNMKLEDKKNFFKKYVGVDRDHYHDLIKQIQQ